MGIPIWSIFFVSLSNRQECLFRKLDHVLKAGAIFQHGVLH